MNASSRSIQRVYLLRPLLHTLAASFIWGINWGLIFAAITPVRQAYLNGLIASRERATVLSFDSLLGSSGAVGIQPILGRVADAWSYPASYVCSAVIQALAIPFIWLARRERAATDVISDAAEKPRE